MPKPVPDSQLETFERGSFDVSEAELDQAAHDPVIDPFGTRLPAA